MSGLGQKKILHLWVQLICIRKRKEPSLVGEWVCLGQSGTGCWFQKNNHAKGDAAGDHPKNRPPHLTGLQRAGGTVLCSKISPPKRKHMNTEPWPQHGETEPTAPGLRWPKSPVRVLLTLGRENPAPTPWWRVGSLCTTSPLETTVHRQARYDARGTHEELVIKKRARLRE